MVICFSGFPPFKDENNHEPTVQAQQYASIFRTNGALHPRHPPPHMTPIEIGNYYISYFISTEHTHTPQYKVSKRVGNYSNIKIG